MAEPESEFVPKDAVDDESSLQKEEALPQQDVQKELSSLEEEANLPIEEVMRRMKERAEAEGVCTTIPPPIKESLLNLSRKDSVFDHLLVRTSNSLRLVTVE